MIIPFGMHEGKEIAEIPDTYLDWLRGEKWFFRATSNRALLQAINRELDSMKRSRVYVPDQHGKTMAEVWEGD